MIKTNTGGLLLRLEQKVWNQLIYMSIPANNF